MAIYSQRDPRWAAQRLGTVNGATLGTVGCYVTAQAESASEYGHNVTPGQLDDIFTANMVDPYNKGGYVNGDMCWDGMLAKVYPNFHFVGTYHCESTPCDVTKLAPYDAYGHEAILEVDFDHNLNDGIQTHFVRMYAYNNGDPIIWDPWFGDQVQFSHRYGDPKTYIVKAVFYTVDLPAVALVHPADLPVAPTTAISIDPTPKVALVSDVPAEPTPAPVAAPAEVVAPEPVVEAPVVPEAPVEAQALPTATPEVEVPEAKFAFEAFETPVDVVAPNGSVVIDVEVDKALAQWPANKSLTVVGYIEKGETKYLQTKNLAEKMPTHGLPSTDFEIYVPKGKLDGIIPPTPQVQAPAVVTEIEHALEQTSSKVVRTLLRFFHHTNK